MPHLILLGDSIFDNAAYTAGGPDVVAQVRDRLPAGWSASLRAVDGATTGDIARQIGRLPPDATHLVLSVGGNNALQATGALGLPAASMAQAVGVMADLAQDFERSYRAAVAACLRAGLPLAVCTIYNGCFPDAAYQRIVATALTLYNDAIFRVAIEHRLPVVDLRAICASPEDYANPIEPSSVGGAKIARAVVGLVTESDLAAGATRIVGA